MAVLRHREARFSFVRRAGLQPGYEEMKNVLAPSDWRTRAPPIDDRFGRRCPLQGVGVAGMGWITCGAYGEAKRGCEFVVVDARNQPIDHRERLLEIGVEQDERERALLRMAEKIGVTNLLAEDLRHF